MAYINTGAYDKWLKQQQQQALVDKYNSEQAALDQKYNNSGLGGFLGNIVGGIGKGIGDVGYALGGLFGTAGASVKDILEGKAGTAENTNAFKRTYYGAKDDKDAAAKAAGNALNAATTLATTVVPVAGAGGTAAKALAGTGANILAGATGGFADELAQNGSDASFESGLKRAASGAITGAVTGGLGNKIGNAKSTIGKALLNNKAVTSTVGRGALSGAVGGATGAGITAGLEGQDMLSAAIEGAKSGAISGGVQAGLTSAAKRAGTKLRDNTWERLQDSNFVKAINNPSKVKEDVYLGQLNDKNFSDIANVFDKLGINGDNLSSIKVKNNQMYLTKSGAEHLNSNRVLGNNMDAKTLKGTMRNATKNGTVLSEPSRFGNATMGASRADDKKIDVAHIGVSPDGDHLELRSTYPVSSGKTYRDVKNTLDGSQFRLATDADGNGLAVGTSALQGDNPIIAQDTGNVNTVDEYGMWHRPTKTGVLANDLNNSAGRTDLEVWGPNDVYDNPQYYALAGSKEANAETSNIVKSLKGASPDQEITIYRATPGNNINDGDWVTLSKQYAIDHNNSQLDGNGNVVEMKVPLKDVQWAGDDLNEWGYFPQKQQVPQEQPQATQQYTSPELPDYTKPVDYQGNELSIRNKNLVEKAGDIFANAGEAIQNGGLYNSLYSKTANRVVKNGSVDKLRAIGFEPSDYGEAAKISTTTNQFVDDIVKNSGAKVNDPDFTSRVLNLDDNIIISDANYKKKYDTQVKNLLGRIETGSKPGEYKADDLLTESRRFGEMANDWRKKSTNVNGDVTNRDGYELANAFTDVKYALRDLASEAVDGFGDKYTKTQLAKRLENLGAPKKAIDYILDADNIGGFIRNTSLFEDARQMYREMQETALRRNAVAGRSTNPITVALNAAGVPQLLEAGLQPVGKLTGGITRATGNVLQKIGSKLPEGGQTTLTPAQQLLLGEFIGRTEGQRQNNQINNEVQKARDYQNLEQLLTEAQAMEMPSQQTQPSANAIKLQSQINQTAGMMEQALAMGDVSAYNKLQTMYNQLYSAYKNEMPDASDSMTTTQKTKLTKLQNATDALDKLESLYSSAGGAQGLTGNISNWLSGVGLNNSLSNYNKTVKTLINQISSAVGSTVSTDLIPRATDSAEEAQNKISTLRQLISQASNNYNQLYGA